MPITAPVGSLTTAIVPRSPTSMAPATTWPPLAAAVSTVFRASSVVRYTDHTSVTGTPGWAAMQPATRTPSFVKLK